jgi:hypothetical protein
MTDSECLLCESTENVDAHHVSYEPEKKIPACRSCHQEIHKAEEHPLKPDGAADNTTIQIARDTKEVLDQMKIIEAESYDSLISRLIRENPQETTEDNSESKDGDVRTLSDDDIQEIINAVAAKADSEGRVDSDSLAREVASQLDYTELANQVANEVENRMR